MLIDNGSEAKLIDKSFVHLNKINTFQLKRPIQLTLGNGEVVQHLTKGCLVDVIIGDHHKQILCYLAKLNIYTVVLSDKWLQTHNSAINWKDCTMKFNSADCMEKSCLLHGKPCIDFAVRYKLKNKIGPNKPTAGGNIDIQQVSSKHFFQMARKKDHKSYLWIPKVSTNDCIKECCAEVASSMRKWCTNTMNSIISDNFDKFMKGKPKYTYKKLLKKIPKEYHSVIDIFMKHEADVLPEHQEEDHTI